MRYSKELGFWEPRYLKNDRVYVNVTKDQEIFNWADWGSMGRKGRLYKKARVLEVDKHYVKALVDGGDLVIVPKVHVKPCISSKRILLIEPAAFQESLLPEPVKIKSRSIQNGKFSIWYLPPFVFLLFVLVAIFWRCQ